jgi:hypothetical protein
MNAIHPDRRRHPRWSQAPRYLEAVKGRWSLAIIAAGLMVIVLNAAPRTSELPTSNPQVESPGVSRSSVAAPSESVQGVTRSGSAFVLERNPPWPMEEFTMRLTMERG